MPHPPRPAPETERRSAPDALVEATLDCIAERGIQATTVRAVAARAGVTNGLIRHHFASKANLIVAAYRRTMELITASSMAVLAARDGEPRERLVRFVAATLEGQASEYRMLSLWATFVSQSRVDPAIAAVRDESYVRLRRATEPLIADVFAAAGRPRPPAEVERMAVAVHAVLDGLWIEAGLNRDNLRSLVELGVEMIEKIMEIALPREILPRNPGATA